MATQTAKRASRNGRSRKRPTKDDGSVTLTAEEAQLLSEMLDKLIAAAEETVRRLDRLHEAFEDVNAALRGVPKSQRRSTHHA